MVLKHSVYCIVRYCNTAKMVIIYCLKLVDYKMHSRELADTFCSHVAQELTSFPLVSPFSNHSTVTVRES